MVYITYVCETVTGKNLGPLECNIGAWSRELNGTDTASVIVPPGAITLANRDFLRLITTPWRMSLVIAWEGLPVFAGPIVARPFDGKTVTLNAVGPRSIFAHRKAHTWAQPYASQNIAYSNLSLTGIASALGVVGTTGKPGASLPIVWQAGEVDSDVTHNRNYQGFALKNISDAWAELTNTNNGPDLDMQPQWTDATQTFIQWAFRGGTIAQPKLQSPTLVSFDASQPQSSVRALSYVEDGSKMETTAWAAGPGTDVGMTLVMSTSTAATSAGFPLLEGQIDHKTIPTVAALQPYADSDVSIYGGATVQFGLSVDVTQPPALGTYQIGDVASVRVKDNLWVPDSTEPGYRLRIMRMSGDSSTTVKFDLQGA